MAKVNTCGTRLGLEYDPLPFVIRWGRREISVQRDCRKRYYAVNPVVDFGTGTEPGYLELLLVRKWLIVLSQARQT